MAKTQRNKKVAPKKKAIKINPMVLDVPQPQVLYGTIQEDGSLLINRDMCEEMSKEFLQAAVERTPTTLQNITAHCIMCLLNGNYEEA